MNQKRTQQDDARVREHLVARRRELAERVTRISKDIHHRDEPLSADFAEQAVELENREVLEALDDDARLELRQIDRALKRIDDGEYAYCEACGEPIAPKRLEALPYSTRCIDCANQEESRRS